MCSQVTLVLRSNVRTSFRLMRLLILSVQNMRAMVTAILIALALTHCVCATNLAWFDNTGNSRGADLAAEVLDLFVAVAAGYTLIMPQGSTSLSLNSQTDQTIGAVAFMLSGLTDASHQVQVDICTASFEPRKSQDCSTTTLGTFSAGSCPNCAASGLVSSSRLLSHRNSIAAVLSRKRIHRRGSAHPHSLRTRWCSLSPS